MPETTRALDENGIIHAGAGENLAQAGAARFLRPLAVARHWCHLLQPSALWLARAIRLARRQADQDSTRFVWTKASWFRRKCLKACGRLELVDEFRRAASAAKEVTPVLHRTGDAELGHGTSRLLRVSSRPSLHGSYVRTILEHDCAGSHLVRAVEHHVALDELG